jgi:hypothetical protein
MGQYYKPTILENDKKTVKAFIKSWDYDNGAKLMEHSYLGNNFVARIEVELLNNPQVLVWAGDYADGEVDENGEPLMNTYEGREYEVNLYELCTDEKQLPMKKVKSSNTRKYILNHDKKEYVVKQKFEPEQWQIHPLPLLTADGNNRGGGDYRSDVEAGNVGRWKRDTISIVTRKSDIPKDFEELVIEFKE